MAGISGSKNEGADSIVLNGGYIDDEDHWNFVLYTGHGGQDTQGRQIRNQQIEDSGNKAFVLNYHFNLPLRVIRGYKGDPKWSPSWGYRYDGIYFVMNYWQELGRDGYLICRYHLEIEYA